MQSEGPYMNESLNDMTFSLFSPYMNEYLNDEWVFEWYHSNKAPNVTKCKAPNVTKNAKTFSHFSPYMNESLNDITHSYTAPHVTWLIRISAWLVDIFRITPSFIWHGSWFLRFFASNGSFVYGCLRNMTQSYILMRNISTSHADIRMSHVTWGAVYKWVISFCLRNMTQSYILHDFSYVSHEIPAYIFNDSFIYFQWFLHIFCRTRSYLL